MIKFGALLKDDNVEAVEIHSKFAEGEVGEAEFVAKARQLLASQNEQKPDENSTDVKDESTNAEENTKDSVEKASTPNVKRSARKSKRSNRKKKEVAQAPVDVVTEQLRCNVLEDDDDTDCEEADNSNVDREKLSNGVELHVKDAAKNETVQASEGQSDSTSPTQNGQMTEQKRNAADLKEDEIVTKDTRDVDAETDTGTPRPHKRFPKRLNIANMGKILTSASESKVVMNKNEVSIIPPKCQFSAYWSLARSFVESESVGPSNLQLGLFRVGATENTSQSAIVIKDVPNIESVDDILVGGTVRFHAPRVPCDVVLRLFLKDDVESKKDDDGDAILPKHVTTIARSSVIQVKCRSTEDVADVLRGILGGIKRGLASPSTNVQNLLATLQSFPCSENKNLVYGCVKECYKLVRNATDEYDCLRDRVVELEKRVEEVSCDSKEEEQKEENTKEEIPSKSKLQKLYLERTTSERRIVELHFVYNSVIRHVAQNQIFSDNMLLSQSLADFCPIREIFANWFRNPPNNYYINPERDGSRIDFNSFRTIPAPSSANLMSIPVIYDDEDSTNTEQVWGASRQKVYLKIVELVRKVLGGNVDVRVFGSSVNGFG